MTNEDNIFDFQILKLTKDFYDHYDKNIFPEILLKKTKRFIKTIKDEAISYIDDYVNHIKGVKIIENKEWL